MKYSYLLVISLITTSLLVSCEYEQLNPKKALITGKISNFDQYSNKKWIEFVHPDLFSQETPFEQIEIGADGSFRYETELVSPALCWGIYNKWIPFVLSPGDSLHVSIDANIWNDKLSGDVEKGKNISISGTVKDDYKSIIAFQNWASDSIYSGEKSREINNAIAKNTALEFKVFIQNKEIEVLGYIKQFGIKAKAGKLYYCHVNDHMTDKVS
ncbi:hypothetical protein [Sediminibacterium sp.]|uniref:hypothetical protein n=1 Tax=Sediminibacterium sp. TaxID=1917865 RepID=UPI0027370C9C|nr:hypothetical protein [Sediminibacterium sp.]MDP3568962.1 hypothetical protein [Sediminibacterium sp.]